MKVNSNLNELYRAYYNEENVLNKRLISAQQSMNNIMSVLPHHNYFSIIDIGAGDGSLLQELDKSTIGTELHAVEISESGYACIKNRKLLKPHTIKQFNGYNIDVKDNFYDLGLATHVLEHVEHERVFIQEIARVCNYLYIEVPLELTTNIQHNINAGVQYGHINFYNEITLRNLLSTCDLEILNLKIFTASLEYEKYLSGPIKGTIKNFLRKFFLLIFPKTAPKILTYIAGVYCKKKPPI